MDFNITWHQNLGVEYGAFFIRSPRSFSFICISLFCGPIDVSPPGAIAILFAHLANYAWNTHPQPTLVQFIWLTVLAKVAL